MEIPADCWDFSGFYSGKPEDTDRFLCKVLAAGAIAIYLDIITKNNIGPGVMRSEKKKSPVERVIHVFDAFVEEASRGDVHIPLNFDPFRYDEGVGDIHIDEEVRDQYSERVMKLFIVFKQQFGVLSCQEILGFDPFLYEEYGEEMQEYIEEGKWMQKCVECIENIIRTICDSEYE
ncbi:MAG: hypothetical protein JSV50_15115 [Desulfobacteraceae bacterium]|nr:MAG: hypothetical protein JSV50_15115 [Desulfobacteraceae bacterium]